MNSTIANYHNESSEFPPLNKLNEDEDEEDKLYTHSPTASPYPPSHTPHPTPSNPPLPSPLLPLSPSHNPPPKTLNIMLPLPLPLTRPLDNMRQIPHRQIQRKVQTRQHNRDENPPSGHGRDESEGAACLFCILLLAKQLS